MRYFCCVALWNFFSSLSGLQKRMDDSDCDNLRLGLLLNDAKLVVKSLESKLTSYSEENLNKLAMTITINATSPLHWIALIVSKQILHKAK
jgi:hypothetical protein